ncbi:iron-siderophore ABC transporter substrate-binding protein [Microvirga arsenatis]|uniref:ABC transporter substrate-binding protein n=1 Tax=Microvirga arsenatis TaxID=2692265 RepID=A0ABW9Z9H0_9HYPH|nr:iron-siderophore ABC transporter substrate-binding protein [Microvirga arsenatis]NBJ13819.1 ABC transporter substrate-binding protein [Microvirga arsenatis]NBJ27289.1 ABC transporter substrate-binding protein [Microvirga arsenatis]
MTWNRRSFLGAALGMPFLNMARASTPGRVAVVDWAMLETLVAIDVVPVAAPELIQFRKIAHEPPIPQQVADLGLRGSPNYEMLRLSQPDLIVSSPWFAWAERNLSRIAPVVSHSIYEPGRLPYAPAEQVTIALGDRLGRTRQARAYIDAASQDIEQARRQLAGKVAGPFFLINLGDARHFRVFGSDSMFGDVLQRLGLENAWTRPTSYAAAAPIPLETLADVPDATIIVISPIPPDAQATLTRSTLWNALPAVRGNRVTILKPINPFGALPAARRFTRLLTEALLASRVHAHG